MYVFFLFVFCFLATTKHSGVFDNDGDQMPSGTEDSAGVPRIPPDVPVPRTSRRSRL